MQRYHIGFSLCIEGDINSMTHNQYQWRLHGCWGSPERAIWVQNCFLKAHRWLLVGSVLYMYWLKTVSVTSRVSISWYACIPPYCWRLDMPPFVDTTVLQGPLARRTLHQTSKGRGCEGATCRRISPLGSEMRLPEGEQQRFLKCAMGMSASRPYRAQLTSYASP